MNRMNYSQNTIQYISSNVNLILSLLSFYYLYTILAIIFLIQKPMLKNEKISDEKKLLFLSCIQSQLIKLNFMFQNILSDYISSFHLISDFSFNLQILYLRNLTLKNE
jgi:hypothetical protein